MEQNDIREIAAHQNEVGKTQIEERIFNIRGRQVMIDRDLALLYQVEVAQMNRQVKRNLERFPDDFMFQLTKGEWDSLKCQNGISNSRGGDRSTIAIEANIRIIRAFVSLRKAFKDNEMILHRIERIEYRQSYSEFRIEELFSKIQNPKGDDPRQGIFFDGQIYDAYTFVADLVRKAARRIVLIDNYIDDTVLTMLSKRADDAVYLVGASIKDLGKKWFGFTLMENTKAEELIGKMSEG